MAYLLLHTEGDPAFLEEVLPPLKSARFIFLPINDNPDVEAIAGGWHWSLLVVSMLDRKAFNYLDLDLFGCADCDGKAFVTRFLSWGASPPDP
jgi:hypothetical protein